MAKTKTLFGISAAVCVACVAAACHPALDLQGISAAFIKCRPSQVMVGNEETRSGLREWDAWYQDEEWHCVRLAWAQTSTSWVGTECRRVSNDSPPPFAQEDPGSTARLSAGQRVPTVPGEVAFDSLLDHQTGE
jgi:hypothetical protein